MKKLVLYYSLVILWSISTPTVGMVTYRFDHIVETSDTAWQLADGAIGEAQLFVDVHDFGGSQVLFTFRNIGPQPSSITDIYFDNGSLLGFVSIDNSDPGVAFSQFASPGNLPGGNNLSPPFLTTLGFSFDSDPPVQPSGVNPQESLAILFDIKPAKTFDDIIDQLNNDTLRIGIHVQGFASGGSEAFVVHTTPAPPAILLGGIGLCIVGWLRRQTSPKSNKSRKYQFFKEV